MSESKSFSDYLNKIRKTGLEKETAETENTAAAEETVPAEETAETKDAEKTEDTSSKQSESLFETMSKAGEVKEEPGYDRKKNKRAKKSQDPQTGAPGGQEHFRRPGSTFVSVKGGEAGSGINSFRDRISASENSEEETEKTSAKDSGYAASHSAQDDSGPSFRKLTEEEQQKEEAKLSSRIDTPESSAVAQTRIVPEEVSPESLRKKAEEKKEKAKKKKKDYFFRDSEEENVKPAEEKQEEKPDVNETAATQETPETKTDVDDVNVFTSEAAEKKENSHSSSDTRIMHKNKGRHLRELAKTTQEKDDDNDDNVRTYVPHRNRQIEEEVSKNREKRINDFHFWSKSHKESGKSSDPDITSVEDAGIPGKLRAAASKFDRFDGEFLDVPCDEFTSFENHRPVFSKLMSIRKLALIKAAVLGVLGIVLFIINTVTAASASANNGYFTVFGGSQTAYITVNLIFILIAAAVMAGEIKRGLFSLLQARPGANTVLLFMMLFAAAEDIAAYFSSEIVEESYHLLNGAVILLCIPVLVAQSFYYENIRHCFKAVTFKNDKSYLRKVSDKNLAASLISDSNNNGSEVIYAGKTRFISDFVKKSRSSAALGQISPVITAAVLGASVLIGAISMLITKNVMFGLSAICFSCAVSFPIGCVFFTGFVIRNENKSLSLKTSFIGSFRDAASFASADNLIIDAKDAFKAEIINVSCFGGAGDKQAVFAAAALTEKTGSLLGNTFTRYAKSTDTKYPEAKGVTYEDKLGFSGWISDCKVLLGSEELLKNHNVSIPESEDKDENAVKYPVLYLAIAGHCAARFTMKYSCRTEAVKLLKALADNGTNILVMASDPNLTDPYAEKLMELPADSVKIVSRKSAEKITAEQEIITDSESAGIVFGDTVDTLCRCAASAVRLDNLRKLSVTVCTILSAAGTALAMLLSFTKSQSFISCWLAVLIQFFSLIICFVLPTIIAPSDPTDGGKATVRPVSTRNVDPAGKMRVNRYDDDDTEERVKEDRTERHVKEERRPVNRIVNEEAEEEDENADGEDENGEEKAADDVYEIPVYVQEFPENDFEGFSLKGPYKDAGNNSYMNPYSDNYDPARIKAENLAKGGRTASSNKVKEIPRSENAKHRPATVRRDLIDEEEIRRPAEKKNGSAGLFGSLKTAVDNLRNRDNGPAKRPDRKKDDLAERFRYPSEKDTEPTIYDLSEPDRSLDFLDTKFVPPELDESLDSGYYNDEYFKRYETQDDIFKGLKKKNGKTFKY